MNPLTGVTEYLRRVERRLRVLAFTRGAAITAAAALVCSRCWRCCWPTPSRSPSPSVTVARVLLFVALALALGIGLIVPLLRLNRRNAARETERKFPEFEERLLTFTERARDQSQTIRFCPCWLPTRWKSRIKPSRPAWPGAIAFSASCVGAAGVALVVLIWLGTSGPGFLGYGTSLLWGGCPRANSRHTTTSPCSPATAPYAAAPTKSSAPS